MFSYTHDFLQRSLDLLFPPRCAGCQRGGTLLCQDCLRLIQPFTGPACELCGAPLANISDDCPICQMRRIRLHGLRYANDYTGVLRKTIHEFKYKNQRRLAGPLGTVLAATFQRHHLQVDALVPLPLHVQRERVRGYNQAVLLARECAAILQVPCLEKVVLRQRDTPAQVGLTSQERLQNMAGAFALCSDAPLEGLRRLLLVDDVCTTGATLEACAAPLYAAGVREIWGLVLARPLSASWKD